MAHSVSRAPVAAYCTTWAVALRQIHADNANANENDALLLQT